MFIKSYPKRAIFCLSILAIVPLGYVIRFNHILPEYIRDAGGSIAYELFWILSILVIYPAANRRLTALWVCLGTCGIELLQLYQPPWLQAIRATLPGRLILGTSFSSLDFPPYVIGSYLGYLWVRWIG
jgi:hypothetical protein